MEDSRKVVQEAVADNKWYNNRAKVIFSLQAFPPLGIYALLRSTAFTPIQKWLVVLGVSLLIGIFTRRMKVADMAICVTDTAKHTARIMAMLIGAFIFMRFLAYTRIPNVASELIVSLNVHPIMIIIIVLVSFLFFGMFFDMYAVVILTTPILFPIIVEMGYDPIWWGVLMCRMIEIGMVTPPFGINLFGLSATAEVPIATMYRGIIPFVIADVFVVALLVSFPILSTFIPNQLM